MTLCNRSGHSLSIPIVTAPDTATHVGGDMVTAMVTKRKAPISRPPAVRRMPFYLREWRNFMGTKVIELAEALEIERESYYRLEREPWRINLSEMAVLAKAIGIKPSQFHFPPPVEGTNQRISLDDLLEDVPEEVRAMAINAVRGMVGK